MVFSAPALSFQKSGTPVFASRAAIFSPNEASSKTPPGLEDFFFYFFNSKA
jgi:hypothetical protein